MFLKIFQKELKDSFRDKRTILLTVLLPVIMMTGLTFFYEQMISDDKGGTFQLAVNEHLDPTVEEVFSLIDHIDVVHSEDPEKSIEDGKVQAALIVDKDFSEKIQHGEKAKVMLIGDSFSQKSSNLIHLVQNALGAYEKSIVSERLQTNGMDPNLVEPMTIEQKEIGDQNPHTNLLVMLIPLMLVIAIGIGSSPAASDLFSGEKEKKTMEALLMTPVKRTTLLISKWLTITVVGSITGIITLIVVAVEINLLTENLKKAVSFGDNVIEIVLLAVVISIIYSMFTASMLMVTSIIGKTVKESQSYSTPVLMLGMFPAMIISTVGVNELTFPYFAIPIMNLFSLFKELLFGVINYEHVLITVVSNLIFIVLLFIVARVLFLKDKWVMN